MSIEQAREIANAVLYEGYLLYPYRQSALKNRQRWTIGVVYPREYSEANGGVEPWAMQTECLILGGADTTLDLYARFLHIFLRNESPSEDTAGTVHAWSNASNTWEWSIASRLASEPQEEGLEREVRLVNCSLSELAEQPQSLDFAFPGEQDGEEEAAGIDVRDLRPLKGSLSVAATPVDTGLFKVTVRIENHTPETAAVAGVRNGLMLHCFIASHAILQVHQGAFVSLMDPPEGMREAVSACRNLHTWPVLIGTEGASDLMLSSPIILYDYPQIAPESPGPLFDGTEIDEILTLRILTLTDEEKQEIRQRDGRAREILERTERLTPEALMKLHGTIRGMRPLEEGER
jgi:hypothetical protein